MAKKKDKKIDFKPEPEIMPLETEDFGEILAGWEIPEFIKPERKKVWYIYLAVIIIALFAYAYFDKNPLFALIVLLSLVLYFVHEKRGPNHISFILTEDGIIIGPKFIDYKDFENFYIIYYPPKIKNLYLRPKSLVRPLITIPLLDQNPSAVRKILLDYLSEDLSKEEIPAHESISDILKF